jgi:AcrR family transcriptional regulator
MKTIRSNRIERKREETINRILTVALKLFKESGIESTTMEQIAEEVDIAKGTLYKYFPAKEAIIDEYIKRSFQEKNAERIVTLQAMPNTKTRLIYTFNMMMEGVITQKEIFEKYMIYRMKILISSHPTDEEKSGFHLIATEIIKLGQENAEIRSDLPSYVLIELFEFAFIEMVKLLLWKPNTFNLQEAVEQYVNLCLYGTKKQEN